MENTHWDEGGRLSITNTTGFRLKEFEKKNGKLRKRENSPLFLSPAQPMVCVCVFVVNDL